MRFTLLLLSLISSSAMASLDARDINADGTIDAYYDTSTDLTWMADANKSFSGVWGGTKTFFGIDGWRLPTAENYASPTCSHPDGEGGFLGISLARPCFGAGFTSEISQMLGTSRDATPFNVSAKYLYVLGTTYTGPEAQRPTGMYWSIIDDGVIATGVSLDYLREWFVHNGDVSPVPEPSTYLLMALGIGALVARRRYCANR